MNYKVAPASAEAMARQYLRENAGSLRLRGDLSDLRHDSTRETSVNRTVRFEQHYQGVPVVGGDIAVSLNNDATVTFVMNGYKPGVALQYGRGGPTRRAQRVGLSTGPRTACLGARDLVVNQAGHPLAHRGSSCRGAPSECGY